MQTFTSLDYLKIDIANNFGLDQLDWDDRIAWFDQNEAQLPQLLSQAKEPTLFFAGCKAYADAIAKIPSGYMISLDATSSGIQLLAALTGDTQAAALCNVIDTGARRDAYLLIYQAMLNLVQDKSKLVRGDVKQAIMTAFYTSKAIPKKMFGEGPLLDIFYSTLQTMAPGAWELNEAMPGFWNPDAYEHKWVLPDNFHCHIKVMDQVKERAHFFGQPFDVFYHVNRPTPEGRSLGANTIHSIDGMIVRELTRRCMYNPAKVDELYELIADGDYGDPAGSPADANMVTTLWAHYHATGYLSARILDHLDVNTMSLVDPGEIKKLLDSLPFRPFTIVSVHDCFRCHPNYGNDLREQYNHQLMLIAKSNLLSNLLSQLAGRPIQIKKLDPMLWKQIGQTNYALS